VAMSFPSSLPPSALTSPAVSTATSRIQSRRNSIGVGADGGLNVLSASVLVCASVLDYVCFLVKCVFCSIASQQCWRRRRRES
jgi:hypothetical protein